MTSTTNKFLSRSRQRLVWSVVLVILVSIVVLLFVVKRGPLTDPIVVPLWPNLQRGSSWIPEAVAMVGTSEHPDDSIANITEPKIYIVPPKNPNGTAVIICPGNQYGALSLIQEGFEVANWLASNGVTGVVLKYRDPRVLRDGSAEPLPLQDVRQAMRIVKERADEWSIDGARIGVMGFSSGGHVASFLATQFSADERPAFAVLVYPIITLEDPNAHVRSRENLLGTEAAPALLAHYSNEKHVTAQTPPTFLVHAADDEMMKVANSELFSGALTKAGVPHEFLRFEKGGHGFGMGIKGGEPATWPDRCLAWMGKQGLLAKP